MTCDYLPLRGRVHPAWRLRQRNVWRQQRTWLCVVCRWWCCWNCEEREREKKNEKKRKVCLFYLSLVSITLLVWYYIFLTLLRAYENDRPKNDDNISHCLWGKCLGQRERRKGRKDSRSLTVSNTVDPSSCFSWSKICYPTHSSRRRPTSVAGCVVVTTAIRGSTTSHLDKLAALETRSKPTTN